MLILTRVCAEFHNRSGQTVLTVRPGQLLSFLEAPEEIQEDPLFSMMLNDGSLEVVRSVSDQRKLESDPLAGITPEGKKAAKARAKTAEAKPESEAQPDPLAEAPESAAVPAENGMDTGAESQAEKTAGEAAAAKTGRKSSK